MGGVSAITGEVMMVDVVHLQKLTRGWKWRRNSSNLLHGLLGTFFAHNNLGLLSTFISCFNDDFIFFYLQCDILVSEDEVLVPRNSLPATLDTTHSMSDILRCIEEKGKVRFLESARRRRAFLP